MATLRGPRHAMTHLLPEEKEQLDAAILEHLHGLEENRPQDARPFRAIRIIIQFRRGHVYIDSRAIR